MSRDRIGPGRVVDRFRIDAVLGRGAMATVYRATHVHLGTVHAIKVLDVAAASVHRRLLVEGRAQASLRHPNVVAVSDVVQIDDALGLVMEFVDGPTLRLLLEKKRLSLAQAFELGCGLLDGVAAAHEAGIVHRDLKPANILLDIGPKRVVPKITDFGLAKVLHSDMGASETRSGSSMGTPAYMAPEQVRDAKDVDHRADVFALGVILYELLAGIRPFEGEDVFAVMAAITRGEHVPLRDRRPDAPDTMIDAVEAALVVDRAERIPDVDALSRAWRAGAAAALSEGPVWTPDLLAGLRSAAPGARLRELATVVPGTGSAAATTDPQPLAAVSAPGALYSGSITAPVGGSRWPLWTAGGIVVLALGATVGLLALRDAGPAAALPPAPAVPAIADVHVAPAEPAPSTTAAVTEPAPAATPPADVPPAAPPTAATRPAAVASPVGTLRSSSTSGAKPASAPAPGGTAEPAPPPVPAPVVEAAPPPAPAPSGPPSGKARVHVRGDKVDVWLRAKGGNFLADRDDVPPGSYAVYAFFPGDPAGTRVMTLDLAAGDERTLTCDGAQLRCRAD